MYSKRLQALTPYVPGEQPRNREYVKLNTNENPFPPAPGVADALKKFSSESLRLYPDPDSTVLREAFAERFGVSKEMIFCGNGSDEVLSLIFYSFFDADYGPVVYPDVSYSFYPVFCSFHGLIPYEIPLTNEFRIDPEPYRVFAAQNGYSGIVFANPNAPTGIALSRETLLNLLESVRSDRLVVVDEAYVDYGGESLVRDVERYPNLLIAGTLSKSYALAGLRLGYAVGQPHLIEALTRAKDSFNSYPVSRLAQELGRRALEDNAYFIGRRDELIKNREDCAAELSRRDWEVLPSASNFLFAAPPRLSALMVYERLKDEGILVRYFSKPRTEKHLRISIGTADDMRKLLDALDRIDPLISHGRT
jgi:histidinol-phosphate aminotransferase